MTAPTLRQRKKDDTRRAISDAATELFAARGFDAVTCSEIAAAAGVAKMTLFNYFARKEELFFDRNEEARGLLASVLEGRRDEEPVLDVLQRAAHQLAREGHVFAKLTRAVSAFWRTVEASAALQAYVREMRSEADAALAEALASAAGQGAVDATARLVAGILVTGWWTAYAEGLGRQRAGHPAEAIRAAFLALVDRAFDAARAAAAGTPYAGAPGARSRQVRG
ncbi:MAG: transcriptional regulator, TetR family [Labilithrix sp.]|nr:transcriptional regulator, TetR family [Labilithrix sp.]